MPTDSLRELIMEQIETTIAGISTGATYFTTFALVERVRQNPLEKEVYPQVCIVEGDESYPAGTEADAPWATADLQETGVRLPLEIWFADRDSDNRSKKGNRILRDLKLALMSLDGAIIADTTIAVRITGDTLPLTVIEAPMVQGAVYATLSFAHAFGNPTMAS